MRSINDSWLLCTALHARDTRGCEDLNKRPLISLSFFRGNTQAICRTPLPPKERHGRVIKKLFRLIIDVLHFNQFYHGARLIKGCL